MQYQKAKVLKKSKVNKDCVELKLSCPAFDYKPGQYIMIKVWVDSEGGDILRAYSISSYYKNRDTFELFIKQVPGGVGSTYLCQHVNADDEIEFFGPLGHFVLKEKDIENKELLMVCTGTGFAPMKAFIEYLEMQGHQNTVNLLVGTRTEDDRFYVDLIQNLPTFVNASIILSKASDQYDGKRGYVNDYLEEMIPNLDNTVAYLCGNPKMVEDVKSTLMEQYGFDKKRVKTEKY